MTFFRNRLDSLIAVTIFTVIVWGHSGGDLFAYDVKTLKDLKDAFAAIAELNSGYQVEINISGTINLTEDLPELLVPAGVTVNINGGTINGNKTWQGLVVNAEETAEVNITNTIFKDCAGTTGIFLDGSDIGFGNTGTPKANFTVSDNTHDISATPGFNKWQKDAKGEYVLATSAGGITINGGNTVTLTGNNNYAGITRIETGATLIADGTALTDSKGNKLKDAFGKTIHNAIGDLSEVRIEGTGKLQLNQSETIGFLSGDGAAIVELNGKTLMISGDEDPDKFGKGINPVTGTPVDAYAGKIVNTKADAELIKTGTGRLILTNDNTNTNPNIGDSTHADYGVDFNFTTTIYQGTVVLGNANALGGGDVTIRNIDTGTGQKLRNVIEVDTTASMTPGAGLTVLNNFNIEKKGKNLDGVSQDFGAFVIGGKENIQFGSNGFVQGGRITGGDLLINMDDKDTQVILANLGGDGADSIAANLNSYGETLIQRGTVVVYEYELTADGTKGSTLGKGNVHAIGLAGYSILSAGKDGMTIGNNLVMDYGSALTLSNQTGITSYTIGGNTSGRGGLIVDLNGIADSVTLTGGIGHTGATGIENGILVIEPAISRASTTLYDLSAGAGGTLKVMDGNLIANIGYDSTYSGIIDMSGGGTLTKNGTGTWIFDGTGTIIDAITVSAGALQLNQDGNVSDVVLNGSGQLIVNNAAVTLDNLTSQSGTKVTILKDYMLTLTNGGVINNVWAGDVDAKIVLEDTTTLQGNSGNSWMGTMEIAGGKTLTVNSPGGLGNAKEAKVTLKAGSTLELAADSRIKQLNVDGVSTVQVNDGKNFTTETLKGSDDVAKTGQGTWAMLGDSGSSFYGNVNLNEGTIHLKRDASGKYDANWGNGELNVNGTDTSLIVDVDNTTNKAIVNQINLNEDLNLQMNDYSKTDPPGTLTLSNISGAGGINYQGEGRLIYDGSGGTIDYTGDTTISGGILDLWDVTLGDGTTFSNVTVKDGGTLTGSGTNNVGNLTFEAGSKLIADYQSVGSLLLNSSGDVTIHDGATAHIYADNFWTTPITLITGTPAPPLQSDTMFWFTNNIQGKRTVGEWDGNDLKIWFVDFVYEDNLTTTSAMNMTSYLYAVVDNTTTANVAPSRGSALIPINTATGNLLLGLENVNPTEYDYALREVGGQINASLVTAQMQTTTGLFQSVAKQLYPVSYMTEPCEDGYAVSNGTIYRGQSRRLGWTGWSSGLGAFGDTKDRNSQGTSGYDYNSYGMSLGIEPTSAMSPYRIGLFYAYSYTDINTKTTIGSGNVSDHFVGAYGRFVDGLGYTSFVAGFGFDKYKTDRDVTKPLDKDGKLYGGHSRADFDGWQGGLYLERGLDTTWTRLGLQPYAGLQYLHSSTDAYAESGNNPFLLETGSSEVNSLRTNLGIRLARQICRVKRGDLYLSGNVSWMHEFLDANCTMTSKWGVSNNPSTFGVSGHSPGRDWAVMGAGMDWKLRQRLSVFGSYDLYANGWQMLNVGNVGARIQW